MKKLVIENVVIEKSEKDIELGVNYNFKEGLNLICGNNEAGKSSLMNFLRTGFFRVLDTDIGKIFFSIKDDNNFENYRADVIKNKKKDSRLKLYNAKTDEILGYDLIEKNINQRYFEQGFTINLDDLMSINIENKTTLVNVIKDPAGDVLNNLLDDIKSKTRKIYGERLTKEVSDILQEVKQLNLQIESLSNKEDTYNNAISQIKNLSEEIVELQKKSEVLNLSKKQKQKQEELKLKTEEYQKLNLNFNEKLVTNKEEYMKILQNAGKYETNKILLEKTKQKLQEIDTKIDENLKHLNVDFSIDLTESDIKKFNINYETAKNIKQFSEQINNFKTELQANKSSSDNLNDNLIALQVESIEYKNKLITNEEKMHLEKLLKFLEEGIKQYNHLSNSLTLENKVHEKIENKLTKMLIIIFAVLTVITLFTTGYSAINKAYLVSVLSFLVTLSSIVGIYLLNQNRTNTGVEVEKQRQIELRNNILSELKTRALEFDESIKDFENYDLILRLEKTKQELQSKLETQKQVVEQVKSYDSKITITSSKIKTINENQLDLESKIIELQKNIKELILSDNNIDINSEIYSSVIDNIKVLKDNLEEKYRLEKEINDILKNNTNFETELNRFILSNSIDIKLSTQIDENILELKRYCDNNDLLKEKISLVKYDIAKLNDEILELPQESFEFCDIDYELDKNSSLIEEKLKEKQTAEFEKKQCEEFQGINELKLQKSIKFGEYRKKIQEVVQYKMVLALAQEAKDNFDKTQPDLVNAEKFLNILTDGKYSKINLNLEEISNSELTNIKKWSELSRGTKEQLYLALRLGYASNYSKDRKTLESNGRADLPLIIDDAFVNFDSIRTKNALKCLIEFSKTNQILYFTCHTQTIKNHLESIEVDVENKINLIEIYCII